jgi:hypothetical protein
LQLAAKSARRADESPLGALSGLTLTKMRSILRQPKANFATAKFGFNTAYKLMCKISTGIAAISSNGFNRTSA